MHFLAEAIRRRTLGPDLQMANPPNRKNLSPDKRENGQILQMTRFAENAQDNWDRTESLPPCTHHSHQHSYLLELVTNQRSQRQKHKDNNTKIKTQRQKHNDKNTNTKTQTQTKIQWSTALLFVWSANRWPDELGCPLFLSKLEIEYWKPDTKKQMLRCTPLFSHTTSSIS